MTHLFDRPIRRRRSAGRAEPGSGTGSAMEDGTINGPHGSIPIRMYSSEAPTWAGLVWVHGGSFVGGDLDMPEADWVARQLAERGVTVVSVDYRLSPERHDVGRTDPADPPKGVHYPVASEEVQAVFARAVASERVPGPWFLGGASAGGNLVAGAALRMLHQGLRLPEAIVLAYPTLHAVQPPVSAELRAKLEADPAADVYGPTTVREIYENYLGGRLEDGVPLYAAPGMATPAQLRGFPPVLMLTGDVDGLRVSGEAFAASLADAGVAVDEMTEPGTRHGHLNEPSQPAAINSIVWISDRIARLAGRLSDES